MKLIIISAISVNGVIGLDNNIPWHIPEDFKHYKETTMGHPVVIGFNTFKTLPKQALKGRTYFVLSTNENNQNMEMDNVHFFNDTIPLLKHLKSIYTNINDIVYIAGGQMIYEEFIGLCDECIITWIDNVIHFTTKDNVRLFPVLDLIRLYEKTDSTDWLTSKNSYNYKITRYTTNK